MSSHPPAIRMAIAVRRAETGGATRQARLGDGDEGIILNREKCQSVKIVKMETRSTANLLRPVIGWSKRADLGCPSRSGFEEERSWAKRDAEPVGFAERLRQPRSAVSSVTGRSPLPASRCLTFQVMDVLTSITFQRSNESPPRRPRQPVRTTPRVDQFLHLPIFQVQHRHLPARIT